ncbi:MAG: hypothetical protein AAGJ46_14020 [Planctomycetota bacterium]
MSTVVGVDAAVGGAIHQATVTQATRASGVIIRLGESEFLAVVQRAEAPMVVTATTGMFSKKHQYLTSYKGLAFYTKADTPLPLPPTCELVQAKGIWVPD